MDVPHHPIADQLAWLAVQPIDSLSREACLTHLARLGEVTRFVQGLHSRFAARLDQVSPTPEADHTAATRGSSSTGQQATRRGRGRRRSGPAGEALGSAMDDGRVSGEHLDVFLAIRATLPSEIRDQFGAHHECIVTWAATLDVQQFRAHLRHLADDLRRQHGINRLDQQRRATQLRTWVDNDGMVRLSGSFDPETGLRLRAALAAMVETLHREPISPHCPDDPGARQDFLRAQALMRLLDHGPTCVGRARAELVVIADTTQRDHQGHPTIDWGLPIELPLDALTRFYATVDRTTIIDLTRQGTLRELTSQVNLGRTTRLANRVQRRLLRALHPTCVVPGCPTPFDRCHIHHVAWWRHGGPTDLANLAPLCHTHHQRVHNDHWTITLDARRLVTLTLPDGTTLATAHAPPWFDLPEAPVPSLSP